MPFDKTASILDTVKKTCGLGSDYDAFDQDILVFLNAAILDLTQNGIGPSDGFTVTDSSQTFEDFIGGFKNVGAVATYLSQKTRIAFDPPTSSYVLEAINKNLAELIWRLNLEAENYKDVDNAGFDDYGVAALFSDRGPERAVSDTSVCLYGSRFKAN